MSIFKHIITDDCVRDQDSDNILKEDRLEVKSIFGIRYWSRKTKDTSEYVKVEKRKVGFKQ